VGGSVAAAAAAAACGPRDGRVMAAL